MMYGATPYYVQAEDYGEETVSVGVKDSFELPAYPIEPPEPEFVSILDFLEEQRSEGNKVKIRDLNTFVMDKEFDDSLRRAVESSKLLISYRREIP